MAARRNFGSTPPPSREIPMGLASPSPDEDSLPRCKHCERPFQPRFDRGRPQLHCSDACRLAYRKASGSESLAGWKYRNSAAGRERRRTNRRRKQIKLGAEFSEPSFDRLKIFARDAWRCQLCGQTVQDSEPAAMNSATIRLRVAIQLGGRYSFDNCETACRQCNGRAAALVARSLSNPSFTLPRSLRFDLTGPYSSFNRSFGSVPATSEAAGVTLVPMPPQSPQDGPKLAFAHRQVIPSHLAKTATARAVWASNAFTALISRYDRPQD